MLVFRAFFFLRRTRERSRAILVVQGMALFFFVDVFYRRMRASVGGKIWHWALLSLIAHAAFWTAANAGPWELDRKPNVQASALRVVDTWLVDEPLLSPPSGAAKHGDALNTSPKQVSHSDKAKASKPAKSVPPATEQKPSKEPAKISKLVTASKRHVPPKTNTKHTRTLPASKVTTEEKRRRPHAPSKTKPAEDPSDPHDFMNPDDQLPSKNSLPEKTPEPRDNLVERLLASERRKARNKDRSRAARIRQSARPRAASNTGAQPRAESPASTSNKRGRTASEAPIAKGRARKRSLDTAIARALPSVASLNENLIRTSAKEVTVHFVVTLRSGKIAHMTTQANTAPATRTLLERTMALLSSGLFYTKPDQQLRDGQRSYRLVLRKTRTAPRDAIQLGHRPPSAAQPGTGFFIARDGLRFDAIVWGLGYTTPTNLRGRGVRVFRL